MDTQNATLALAFAAGFLSFVSPCCLPLVPAYIGYLSGQATQDQMRSRFLAFSHSLAFVLGFTTIFAVIFGLAAGLLGEAFANYLDLMRQVGGIIVIGLGLHLLGVIHIGFLDYDRRLGSNAKFERRGYLTSYVVGLSFAAGWTPCVGPMLGAIFSLALNEGEAGRSVFLFFVYSMGLGLPFLITALMLETISQKLVFFKRHMQTIERISGLLLIVIGVLLLTNGLFRISRLFQWVPPI